MAITCVGLAPIARLEHRRPSRATGNAHLQTVSRMTACRVTSISRAVRQGERTGETKGLLTAAVSQWRCHHRRGGLPSGKPSAAAAARSVGAERVDLDLRIYLTSTVRTQVPGSVPLEPLVPLPPRLPRLPCCGRVALGRPARRPRPVGQAPGQGLAPRARCSGRWPGVPTAGEARPRTKTHETRCTNTHRNQS